MPDDIQKKTNTDQGSESLKGDIAKILEEVKLPETQGEQLSRAIASSDGDISKIVEDVGLVKKVSSEKLETKTTSPSAEIAKILEGVQLPDVVTKKTSAVPPIVNGDIAKIIEQTKLPETRTIRTTGDVPVTSVMPHEPLVSTELIGSKTSPEAPEKPAPPKDPSAVVPLRTLKDDMSAIVQSSKISFIRAAALEEEKKSKVSKVTSMVEQKRSHQRTRHILGMLFAILMLFGIGGAALFGVYTITSLQQGTQSTTAASSILFSERSVSLITDGQTPDQIKQILGQARVTPGGAIGSITRIVPVVSETGANGKTVQRTATLAEFFESLGTRAPDDLLRALNDSFFFGFHTIDRNVPVMVIPVLSYSRAFEGMLSWEPFMNADLVPIFTSVPAQTWDENNLPVLRTFTDAVMNNYDVRQLKDDAGAVVLYYSFPTTQILVIAESPYSFVEVLSRLQAGRRL